MSKKAPFLYNKFSDQKCYKIVTDFAASISFACEEVRYHIPGTQFSKEVIEVSYVQCWIKFLICECFQAGACLDVEVSMF